MCPAHDWNVKSQDKWRQLCFVSVSWVRPSCKIPTKYSILPDYHFWYCAYTIYTHITHRCWGVFLRENPSHKPWELEIVIPTFLYTFACGFSSTTTSPFPYHWEVDSPNTYHTLLECSMRFGAAGKYWKKPSFGRCNQAYCEIRRVKQDTVPRSLVGVGAWRA